MYTTDPVRCPFCVEGDNFKLMALFVTGTYICSVCNHTVRENDATFICACSKCVKLNPVQGRRNNRSVV